MDKGNYMYEQIQPYVEIKGATKSRTHRNGLVRHINLYLYTPPHVSCRKAKNLIFTLCIYPKADLYHFVHKV